MPLISWVRLKHGTQTCLAFLKRRPLLVVESHALLCKPDIEGHRAGRELQHPLALGNQDDNLHVVLTRPGS